VRNVRYSICPRHAVIASISATVRTTIPVQHLTLGQNSERNDQMQNRSILHLEAGEHAVPGDEEHVERALPRRHGVPVAVIRLRHRRRHRYLRVAHAAFHLPVYHHRHKHRGEAHRKPGVSVSCVQNGGKIRGKSTKNHGQNQERAGKAGNRNPSSWHARPPSELAGTEVRRSRSRKVLEGEMATGSGEEVSGN
jgi:hypothetical protein